MNKQNSFLSFFREVQKENFPEVKDLRKFIGGLSKSIPAEFIIPKNCNKGLVKLSLKNIYFLSYAIRSLVQNLKNQKLRDLEENLIVQIEVQLQLLSAQLESTVFGDEPTRERSQTVLSILLSNQFREVSGIFQELKMLSGQKDNSELTSTIESLDKIFRDLNKNLANAVQDIAELNL